jgi:hypothetical protein
MDNHSNHYIGGQERKNYIYSNPNVIFITPGLNISDRVHVFGLNVDQKHILFGLYLSPDGVFFSMLL